MHTAIDSQTVADLVDEVAALDDAPDRNLFPWFYADLARLAADTIDDHLTNQPDNQDAYDRGHAAGYRHGLDDARRRTRPAARSAGRHRTANRRGGSA